MYIKDKFQRITLRLNDSPFNYVKSQADILGVSPSEFLRMVINFTMNQVKELEVKGRENDKNNINNILQH